jgi:hypothetical protein
MEATLAAKVATVDIAERQATARREAGRAIAHRVVGQATARHEADRATAHHVVRRTLGEAEAGPRAVGDIRRLAEVVAMHRVAEVVEDTQVVAAVVT